MCADDVLEYHAYMELDPGRTYGRIEIKASNLKVDGRAPGCGSRGREIECSPC